MKSELMLNETLLVAGAVRGWRCWSAAFTLNDEVFLTSISQRGRWSLLGATAAMCGHQLAATISPDCGCGLYATLTLTGLSQALGDYPHLFTAEVELWGSVARYEGGYRAQYGRILPPIYICSERDYLDDENGPVNSQKVADLVPCLPLAQVAPVWAKTASLSHRPAMSFMAVSEEQAKEAVRDPKVVASARALLKEWAKKRGRVIKSFYVTCGVGQYAAEVAPGVAVVRSAVTGERPWIRAVLEHPNDPAAKQLRLYWNPVHNRWLRGNMR